MRSVQAILAVLLGALALGFAAPASAQTVAIGTITAKEECRYFRNSAGVSRTVASPWIYARSAAWVSWWVKDCERQFQTMRDSLAAAFASSGRFSVGGDADYVVSMTLSGITDGRGARPVAPATSPGSYSVKRDFMTVTADVMVRDRSGRIVYGGPLVKKVETGTAISADGTIAKVSNTGEAVYGQLQQEVAMAAARLVAFNIQPLLVTAVDGYDIKLNYGSPFLRLGSLVEIEADRGIRRLKYRVTSASPDYAIAEMEGDNDPTLISAGAPATFIEADSPEANGRVYKRTRLP